MFFFAKSSVIPANQQTALKHILKLSDFKMIVPSVFDGRLCMQLNLEHASFSTPTVGQRILVFEEQEDLL